MVERRRHRVDTVRSPYRKTNCEPFKALLGVLRYNYIPRYRKGLTVHFLKETQRRHSTESCFL